MKVSILNNKQFFIGIDYSEREDCVGVFDLTNDQIQKIKDGCEFEIIEGEFTITENDTYTKSQIKSKLDRMREIRLTLVQEGFTVDLPTDLRIDSKLLIYKQELLQEYSDLQIYVDENFESNLIDDVINSFF